MAVDVQGKAGARMPQPGAYRLDVQAACYQQGSMRVPQTMESDAGQTRLLENPGESMVYRARVQGFVPGMGKDEVGLR